MAPRTVEFLPSHKRRVLIAANPAAGARSGRSATERVERLLRQRGYVVTSHDAMAPLRAEAAKAQEAGVLRAIIAAGGDGTAAMVANCTGPGTPILVFPLGTENLLARHLGLTADPEAACDTVSRGVAIRLDAGQAGRRLFLLMVGCGLDAEVVQRLHSVRRGHIGRLSYAKPILDSLRSYEYPELRVYCPAAGAGEEDPDDGDHGSGEPGEPIRARWVFVANLPRYASGLQIAPDADGGDGLLDLCALRRGSMWHGLRYLAAAALGRLRAGDDCVRRRAARLRIESDQPVPYQLDGDPGGRLPLEIRVLPQRLMLLVSERWAGEHGFRAPTG